MAGLGFKDFAVGEVLTSADVDGYLMQQSVMRFADSGARGSALGTAVGTGVPLAEGMVAYLDDTNLLEVYDGTEWRSPGRVLQVVSATDTTDRTTTSGTYSDTGVSVTITPRSASSTLYVQFSGAYYIRRPAGTAGGGAGTTAQGTVRLTDSSDVALEGAEGTILSITGTSTAGTPGDLILRSNLYIRGKVASSSTSSRTYKLRFKEDTADGTLTIRNSETTGLMTVWEVL